MDEKELNSFRNILLGEEERIQESLRAAVIDLKANAEQPSSDVIDEAVMFSHTSMSLRMKERDNRLLSKVKLALDRIREKTYGECYDCGEDIGLKRLKIRPVTTLCIMCKEIQEREESSFANA